MAILEVEHIKKKFGKTDVLKDISFSLEQGEVLSIIGSSGSGKTTLLRCLNFLEMPDNGIIRVNNEILLDTDKPETLRSRRFGRNGCTLDWYFSHLICSRSTQHFRMLCWQGSFWQRKDRTIRQIKRTYWMR